MQNQLETACNRHNLKTCADQIGEIRLNKAILKPERKQVGDTSQSGQYKDDSGSKTIPDNRVQ
ncbi:hypothetical protein [Dyadobacter sp. SG02]|uniref:hypothetical protein n=1 Tax=Dyadobacter sp. SG02 TaxID=1855291 RepID=UPI001C4342AB|nr:hypothetical protein [Dyadobacter sp. SG02]